MPLHLQPHAAEKCFAETLLLQDFDSSMECDGGLGDDVLVSYETPLFQGVLMSYLDDKAPVIGETPHCSVEQSLVWLYLFFYFLLFLLQKFSETPAIDDKESVGSDSLVPSGTPYFQAILMSYLDEQAPSLGEVLFLPQQCVLEILKSEKCLSQVNVNFLNYVYLKFRNQTVIHFLKSKETFFKLADRS